MKAVKDIADEYLGIEFTDEQINELFEFDKSLREHFRPDDIGIFYLSRTLVKFLLPGAPTVEDSVISGSRSKWYWPLHDSDRAYKKAFVDAFNAAAAAKYKVVQKLSIACLELE